MSHVTSPVKKIDELLIHRMPSGQVIPAVKAVKADGITFILGNDGKIYSNSVQDRAYYGLTRWRFASPLVNALHRMGVITKNEAKAHIDACRRADEKRERQYACAQLSSYARKFGITLTANQKRTLKLHVKNSQNKSVA